MGQVRKLKKQLMIQRMTAADEKKQVAMMLEWYRRAGFQVFSLADAMEATGALMESVGMTPPEIMDLEAPPPPPPQMVLQPVPRPHRHGVSGVSGVAAPVAAPAVAAPPPPARALPTPARPAPPRAIESNPLDDLLNGAFGAPRGEDVEEGAEPEAVEAGSPTLLTQEQILAKFNARVQRAEAEGVRYSTGGGGGARRMVKPSREEQARALAQAGITVGEPQPSPVPKPVV